MMASVEKMSEKGMVICELKAVEDQFVNMLNSFYNILTFVNIRFLCSLLISLCPRMFVSYD